MVWYPSLWDERVKKCWRKIIFSQHGSGMSILRSSHGRNVAPFTRQAVPGAGTLPLSYSAPVEEKFEPMCLAVGTN